MNKCNNRCMRQKVDSFYAFLTDGADYTPNEEYPIISKKMISTCIPETMLPFSKAINTRKDLSKTFIHFFSPDKTFERIRRNPNRYIAFFKRTAGIIGPDFSIHSDMPVSLQKSQIFDNLALSYYFGRNGIPVIPNLRCGIDELLPEFFLAIPQNAIVAVSTHGFIKEKWEQYEWYCFLEQVISVLNPKCIIVHGTLNSKIFTNLTDNVRFVFYTPWINEYGFKGGVKNGN